MAQEVAAEGVFLDQATVGVVDIFNLIVGRFPARQFIGGEVQSNGSMAQHLADTKLDIPRQIVLILVEFLHLTTQVLGH